MFVGHYCPPGSGFSNSSYCGSMRIRIQIRILNPGSNFLSERWRVLELSCGFNFPAWKTYISVMTWVPEAILLIAYKANAGVVGLYFIFVYVIVYIILYSLWFHIWKDFCLSAETRMGCRDEVAQPSTALLQSDASLHWAKLALFCTVFKIAVRWLNILPSEKFCRPTVNVDCTMHGAC